MRSTNHLDARILAVDDEIENLRLLECALLSAGYRQITSTSDPRRVAGLLGALEPDLLLLDLQMPWVHGVTLLERIRSSPAPLGRLPVLVITGDKSSATQLRVQELEVQGYLTKPYSRTELLVLVTRLLETPDPQASQPATLPAAEGVA